MPRNVILLLDGTSNGVKDTRRSALHLSVIERIAAGYKPVNLPADFAPVPPRLETAAPNENGQ